jgi:hypothetical protein
MCGDPNCKYISLIEDEEGGKSAIHYGLNNDEFYILWTDYWQPEDKQYKAHQWRPVNRTRKIKRNKNKTQKNLKNRVIRLGF